MEAWIIPGVVFLAWGLTVWLIQRGFNKSDDKLSAISKRMDCFEQSQHACQLSNAKDYATWEFVNRLDSKVDGIDTRLTRVESKGP